MLLNISYEKAISASFDISARNFPVLPVILTSMSNYRPPINNYMESAFSYSDILSFGMLQQTCDCVSCSLKKGLNTSEKNQSAENPDVACQGIQMKEISSLEKKSNV